MTLREHLEAIRDAGGAMPDSRIHEHAVAALAILDNADELSDVLEQAASVERMHLIPDPGVSS